MLVDGVDPDVFCCVKMTGALMLYALGIETLQLVVLHTALGIFLA